MKNFLYKAYKFITNKFYFKLLYLLISLTYTTILFSIPGLKILNKICIIWGMILILFSFTEILLKKRKIFFFEYFLYGFLIVTFCLNIFRYPTKLNLKIWLINIMIMLVIFSIDIYKSKIRLIKELNIISYFYTLSTFILSTISLIVIFSNNVIEQTFINADGVTELIVYRGIFRNENSLGIAAGISFLISIYLFVNSYYKKIKIFLAVNIIIQLLAVVISGGRSSLLLLISLPFAYIFIYIKNIYARIGIIIFPIVLSGFIFTLNDKILYYIFTGRQYIWRSALGLIEYFPFYGWSNENLVPTLIQFQELLGIPTLSKGIVTGGVHNIYLHIGATNGLISLLFILLFILFTFIFLVKNIEKLDKFNKNRYTILLSLFLGILLVNLMESNLVYIISFVSLIFWIYSGYLIAILSKEN